MAPPPRSLATPPPAHQHISSSRQHKEMSFYAQMDPKNPFGLFPTGFHHSPFSLVPNPTANPLLQQQTNQHQQQQQQHAQQQVSQQQNNNKYRRGSDADAWSTKSSSTSSKEAEKLREEKHAHSMRDKQTIIFDAAGKKMYGCTICEFKTKQKGLLKVHINSVHYKMKIFNCDLCKFTTVQKGNLRAHVLTVHEKIRSHPCDFCDYRAGTKGILKTHIKNKHLRLEKDVFDCHMKAHLKEHLKNEHR